MFSIPDKFHLAFDNWTTIAMLLMILIRNFRVDSITCHQTEYKTGDECCPLCPAGERVEADCTEAKSTDCQRCSDGTFMDLPNGLKRCNPCSTCDSGAGLKVKWHCRRSTDTICEPMEGFFCTNRTRRGCVETQLHRRCEPGQYISRNGTDSTDTECSECSSGSFSDGTMFSCQPHRQWEEENLLRINTRTSSTNAECGEKSSNTTGVVIIVLVYLLVAAIIVIVATNWCQDNSKNSNTKHSYKMAKIPKDTTEGEEQGECLRVQTTNSHADDD